MSQEKERSDVTMLLSIKVNGDSFNEPGKAMEIVLLRIGDGETRRYILANVPEDEPLADFVAPDDPVAIALAFNAVHNLLDLPDLAVYSGPEQFTTKLHD